ncbi:unnamed protein product, partial [Musa textilis]
CLLPLNQVVWLLFVGTRVIGFWSSEACSSLLFVQAKHGHKPRRRVEDSGDGLFFHVKREGKTTPQRSLFMTIPGMAE